MIWDAAREADLAARWGKDSVRALAIDMQTSAGALYRQARKLGLPIKKSRHLSRTLGHAHVAIRESRPLHARRIVTAETSTGLFVKGKESRKIGPEVTKGRWKGMPLYTITLAERITCPRSCLIWDGCYGNNLNWPRRHLLDRDLIARMRWELTALAARHRDGFVVRIHVLGDFGSDADIPLALDYVSAWRNWLDRFPALRVFGFTAWSPDSPVGIAVDAINTNFADRWRVRFSGHALGGRGALVVDRPEDSRHMLCPWDREGTDGKPLVANCGACALCWSMDRTIEFARH